MPKKLGEIFRSRADIESGLRRLSGRLSKHRKDTEKKVTPYINKKSYSVFMGNCDLLDEFSGRHREQTAIANALIRTAEDNLSQIRKDFDVLIETSFDDMTRNRIVKNLTHLISVVGPPEPSIDFKGFLRDLSDLQKEIEDIFRRMPYFIEVGESGVPKEGNYKRHKSNNTNSKQEIPMGKSPRMVRSILTKSKHKFDVAFSLPGELRPLVHPIAVALSQKLGEDKIFYDRFYEAELASLDLDILLQSIYHDRAKLIAVFLCADYKHKEWCGLEWRAVRDLIKQRRNNLMLFKMDDTEIPGIYSLDGYIDVRNRSCSDLVQLILERLSLSKRHTRRVGNAL